MSSRKHIRKPSNSKSDGIHISGGNDIIRGDVVAGEKVVTTPEPKGENIKPRMAGDITTDAPPPEGKKKRNKGK